MAYASVGDKGLISVSQVIDGKQWWATLDQNNEWVFGNEDGKITSKKPKGFEVPEGPPFDEHFKKRAEKMTEKMRKDIEKRAEREVPDFKLAIVSEGYKWPVDLPVQKHNNGLVVTNDDGKLIIMSRVAGGTWMHREEKDVKDGGRLPEWMRPLFIIDDGKNYHSKFMNWHAKNMKDEATDEQKERYLLSAD